MPSIKVIILVLCWGLFFLVWGLGWIYNLVKGPKSQTSASIDYISILGLTAVFLVSRFVHIFSPTFAIHLPFWTEAIGAVWMIAATGLALWARFALGTMWSSHPTTKVGHQLRTDGPYRISRHPIYTGLIGMLFGSSILVSSGNFLVITAALVQGDCI